MLTPCTCMCEVPVANDQLQRGCRCETLMLCPINLKYTDPVEVLNKQITMTMMMMMMMTTTMIIDAYN
jgi:hypothetical protein